ncbi:exodeoxyribonuclease VII small subunit [Aminicella lysinilytica]|uniref:Exodeoxyribonuclease VII small subunit n=1 Tax=Aminicella lysinilytica TaxID=433323 RepID=A0A4R6Q8Y5_9FIRM|nr:exodeoxyribonuclease VII small subunit [Aminicella lysinilytica]NLD11744.1 exodeoxyribonuclease VII small subunit [Clostridiales bacterium]TDP58527.1 exodeoxyribonuclease VII small subunit [Aminicella lysinilytica]
MAINGESFETSLEKLREMSEKIKSPETDLEGSIRCYEEGMKYYKNCEKILAEAKQKIETFELEQ